MAARRAGWQRHPPGRPLIERVLPRRTGGVGAVVGEVNEGASQQHRQRVQVPNRPRNDQRETGERAKRGCIWFHAQAPAVEASVDTRRELREQRGRHVDRSPRANPARMRGGSSGRVAWRDKAAQGGGAVLPGRIARLRGVPTMGPHRGTRRAVEVPPRPDAHLRCQRRCIRRRWSPGAFAITPCAAPRAERVVSGGDLMASSPRCQLAIARRAVREHRSGSPYYGRSGGGREPVTRMPVLRARHPV
jgi:hypothetical protein